MTTIVVRELISKLPNNRKLLACLLIGWSLSVQAAPYDEIRQLLTAGRYKAAYEQALLLRSLEVKTASEPWFAGYRRASATPCIVRAECRPFIGVSPGVAPALISFLRQQGYILETSPDPELYPFYLDLGSFSRQDGRRLIREIEEGDFPLARLGRWPDGAHSALTITGDIDALTLWDYGLRLLGN